MRTLVLLGVAGTALALTGCGRVAGGLARAAFRGGGRAAAPELVTYKPVVKLAAHGGGGAAPELVTFRPVVKVPGHAVAEVPPPPGVKWFVPAPRESVTITPSAAAPGARGAGRATGEGATTRGGARPAPEESVGERIADEIAKELIQQIAGADAFQERDRDHTPIYSLPLPPRRSPETIPSRPTARDAAPPPLPPPAP